MITAVRSNMGEAEHNAANLRHTKQMYEKEAKKANLRLVQSSLEWDSLKLSRRFITVVSNV